MKTEKKKWERYDVDFKYKIVQEKLNGASYSYLANKYDISKGTIATWVHRLKMDGALNVKPIGRQKESDIDYKERYEILKKFKDFLENETHDKK